MAEIQSSELHDVQRIGQKVIQDYGIEILVVSVGANGASIISKSEYLHVHAPRVPVKSTVGAGDSLLSGVVFALDSGHTLKEVLKWGVACGTATTMNEGTGLFQLDQVEKVKSLIR
jgi:6-phosphofructokinase 2